MLGFFKYFWKAKPISDFKSAGPEVPAISNAPAALLGSGNPQACFMGLPIELRCQIYEYLFSGARYGQACGDGGHTHCCTEPDDPCAIRNQEVSHMACCTCARLPTQIFAANKFIYREAASVFYRHVEVRLIIPNYRNSDIPEVGNIGHSPMHVRVHWLGQIRHAVMVSDVDRIDCEAGYGVAERYIVHRFCDLTMQHMSELSHLEIHIDITRWVDVVKFKCEDFDEIAYHQNLRTITPEIGTCQYPGLWERERRDYDQMIAAVNEIFVEMFGEALNVSGSNVTIAVASRTV